MTDKSSSKNEKVSVMQQIEHTIKHYQALLAAVRPYCTNRYKNFEILKQDIYTQVLKDLDKIKHVAIKSEVQDIPEDVSDLIQYYKESDDVDLQSILITFSDWYNTERETLSSKVKWILDNPEKFMRAWLSDYTIKDQVLYFVTLPDNCKSGTTKALVKHDDGTITLESVNILTVGKTEYTQLTKEEIESVDKRYMNFAYKVEEDFK